MRQPNLLDELKRRRVYRVSAAYVVAAFAVLEAADLVLPALQAPPWLYRTLVILAMGMFPLVVVLAWVFDVTPSGVRRTGPAPAVVGGDEEDSPGEAGPRASAGWTGRPLLVFTVLIGVVGVGAWFVGRRSAAAPVIDHSATLAVLPFMPALEDPELERVGRELVITLSHSLTATAGLHAAEPLAVLATVSSDEGPLPPSRARAAARSLGAANLIHGAILRADEGLRLEIGLYSTDDMEQLAAGAVTGHRTDRLAEAATIAILRMIWTDSLFSVPNPGAISTTSTEALRAYLDGERSMAEGRWREAPEAFSRAIAADSSFGAAYWRLQYALEYHGSPVDSLVRARAWEMRDQLSEPDRRILEARSESTQERLRSLRETTRRFPTHWPAWWDLAELLVHQGGYIGYDHTESRAVLERTLALNPRLVSAWTHRFWIASRTRDAEAMAHVIDELANARYDQVSLAESGINSLTYYEAQHAFVAAGEGIPDAPIEVGVDELSAYRGQSGAAQLMATSLLRDGFLHAQIQLAREILRSGRAHAPMERSQHYALAYALAGCGMWDRALQAADEYAASAEQVEDLLVPYRIAAVGAWIGELDTDEAAQRSRRFRSVVTDAADLLAEAAWLDGLVAFAARDAPALERARAELASGQAVSRDVLFESLGALALALAGDSTAAGRRLHELELEWADQALQWSYGATHPFVNGVNRLGAARWLLADGDTVAARRLLRWHEVVLPSQLHHLSIANQVLARPALHLRRDLARTAGSEPAAAAIDRLLRERRPVDGR